VRKLVFLLVVVGALWATPGAFAAWCGSGESSADRPDVVTGPQVHAIVAVPSDAPDTFAQNANQLSDDVASITSWWQGQDPTRVPRFDMATFPGGTCLDVSFARMSSPASSFAGANKAFSLLANTLFSDGYNNPFKKYLIYYPASVEPDICGTGAGTFDAGPAYAVVWLQACGNVPTDAVAVHELLHALGALPTGAPNFCTPATDPVGVTDLGHPCDSSTDVLFPYSTAGVPLTSLVLDYNHNDYYGHSGSWPDLQDSVWLHLLGVAPVSLTVRVAGTGHGTIASDVPGVDCTSSCTTSWDPNSALTLTATPASGSRFLGWTGPCAGLGAVPCSLTLQAPQAASALFGPATISVKVSTSGKGTVTCVPRCSSSFTAGTPLNLIAQPAKGWKFYRWSGACKGTQLICRPSTDRSFVAKATFKKKPVVKKR
jgi:Divergent InlB B-repeat domain